MNVKDATSKRMVNFLVFSQGMIDIVKVNIPGESLSQKDTISGRIIKANVPAIKYNAAIISILQQQNLFLRSLYKKLESQLPPMYRGFVRRTAPQSLPAALARETFPIAEGKSRETAVFMARLISEFDTFKKMFTNGTPILVDPLSSEFVHPPLLYYVRHGEYLFQIGEKFKKTIRAENAGNAYQSAIKIYNAFLERYREAFKSKARQFYAKFSMPLNSGDVNVLDFYNTFIGQLLHATKEINTTKGLAFLWQNGSHDFYGVRFGTDNTIILSTSWQAASKPGIYGLSMWNRQTRGGVSIVMPLGLSLDMLFPSIGTKKKDGMVMVGFARVVPSEDANHYSLRIRVEKDGKVNWGKIGVASIAKVSISNAPDKITKMVKAFVSLLTPNSKDIWLVKSTYAKRSGKKVVKKAMLNILPGEMNEDLVKAILAYTIHRSYGGKSA